jgi:hypothetical protein
MIKETAMNPLPCELTQAHIADLHRQAAIRGRRPLPRQRTGSVTGHTVTGLARRVLTLAGGCVWALT